MYLFYFIFLLFLTKTSAEKIQSIEYKNVFLVKGKWRNSVGRDTYEKLKKNTHHL